MCLAHALRSCGGYVCRDPEPFDWYQSESPFSIAWPRHCTLSPACLSSSRRGTQSFTERGGDVGLNMEDAPVNLKRPDLRPPSPITLSCEPAPAASHHPGIPLPLALPSAASLLTSPLPLCVFRPPCRHQGTRASRTCCLSMSRRRTTSSCRDVGTHVSCTPLSYTPSLITTTATI